MIHQKNRIVFFLLFIIFCSSLYADDVADFFSESRQSYIANPSAYSEKEISRLLEISMLVNDFEFAHRISSDFLSDSNTEYSEDLFIMFIRFAYSSNDNELMGKIISRLPESLDTHLKRVHEYYIKLNPSDVNHEKVISEMQSEITRLPEIYSGFYESLLFYSEYYIYFTPMTFSSAGHDIQGNTIKTTAESETAANTVKNSNTYIQVGSFTVEENASELAKELNIRNFRASINESNIQGQTYYRVIVLVETGYTLDKYLEMLYEHGYGGIRY